MQTHLVVEHQGASIEQHHRHHYRGQEGGGGGIQGVSGSLAALQEVEGVEAGRVRLVGGVTCAVSTNLRAVAGSGQVQMAG